MVSSHHIRHPAVLTWGLMKMKEKGYATLTFYLENWWRWREDLTPCCFTLRTDEDEAERIRHPSVIVLVLVAVHDVTWLQTAEVPQRPLPARHPVNNTKYSNNSVFTHGAKFGVGFFAGLYVTQKQKCSDTNTKYNVGVNGSCCSINKECFSTLCRASVTHGFCCVWSGWMLIGWTAACMFSLAFWLLLLHVGICCV